MPGTAGELEHARQAVDRFVARFDESYRLLACHAAIPLVLTPELLGHLRAHFLRGRVPWVAEVDLLLAVDLCRPVGHEQYALDPAVRAYLLAEIRRDPDLGPGRMQAVARLLLDHVHHLARTRPGLGEANLQAQEWAAMAFLDDRRERASQAIAAAFREAAPTAPGAPTPPERAELARLARITRDLAPQLGDYPELVAFAEDLGRMLADPRGIEVGPPAPASRSLSVAPPDPALALPTIRPPAPPIDVPAGIGGGKKVYVSAPSLGIFSVRHAIDEALKQIGFDPVGREGLPADNPQSFPRVLADVAACDIYIGILTGLPDPVPKVDNPEGLSRTELEYRHAVRLGKTRLFLLLAEDAGWGFEDPKRADPSIRRFRDELMSREVVQFFRTVKQLPSLVIESLLRIDPTNPPAGTPSAAEVPAPAPEKAGPARDLIEIYVSRSRVDDVPLPGEYQGWIGRTIESLTSRIAAKLGRRHDEFRIRMDTRLSTESYTDPRAIDQIRRSDVFLVFFSPAYSASTRTQAELKAILDAIGERLPADRGIFVIELDQVGRPAELGGFLGYRFWEENPRVRRTRLLMSPRSYPEDPRYLEILEDLARDLSRYIEGLRQRRSAPRPDTMPPPHPAPAGGRPVYLAVVTQDLEDQRDEVRHYLEQAGVRVLPDSRYPSDLYGFRKAAQADMLKAVLFVQLLSELSDRRLDGIEATTPTLQKELAERYALPLLQWRSPDLDPAQAKDDQARRLLERPAVFACDLDEFKAVVLRRYEQITSPAPTRPARDRNIFVNCVRVDLDLAREVCEGLMALGISVSLPLLDGEPSEILENQGWELRTCDALLVIHGKADAAWVRRQLMEARRAEALREAPLRFVAVYWASPKPIEPSALVPNPWMIDGRRGFAVSGLAGVIQDLLPGRDPPVAQKPYREVATQAPAIASSPPPSPEPPRPSWWRRLIGGSGSSRPPS